MKEARSNIPAPWLMCLLLILYPLTAPAPYFMKLGDIKGESKDEGHDGWIDLYSVNQTLNKSGAGASAFELSFQKGVDRATPVLFQKCCAGELLSTGQYDSVVTNGGKIYRYQMHFDQVQVREFQMKSAEGKNPAMEECRLSFPRFSWTYTVAERGSNVVDESTWWDAFQEDGGDLADRVFRATGALQEDGSLKVSWVARAGTTYSVRTSPVVDGVYGEAMQHPANAAGPQQVILPPPMAHLFVRLEELP